MLDADPAGDWPAAILALGAELVAQGKSGERVIKAEDFFGNPTTALQEGEILREIRINKPQSRHGHAYQKVRHPASGFAVVGVAANLGIAGNGSCESAAIGITGVGSKAYRAQGVESATVSNWMNKKLPRPHHTLQTALMRTQISTPRNNIDVTSRQYTLVAQSTLPCPERNKEFRVSCVKFR